MGEGVSNSSETIKERLEETLIVDRQKQAEYDLDQIKGIASNSNISISERMKLMIKAARRATTSRRRTLKDEIKRQS